MSSAYTDKFEISGAGDVAINTTTNTLYKLNVGGDVNITGDYRKAGALYKPAGAVLADTATILATSRNTSGVEFNGSADIAIDYFALNNKPITLLPSTTNLQVGTGNNLIVGSVASGTIERLSVGGNIRATGNITVDTNLTATGTSTLTGRVGIGKAPHATYACDVNGTLNATSVLVNGFPVGGGLSQGMVVQMKHLTYTQMDVKNTTGWDAINDNITTGFVVAITPSSASSKILVNMVAHIGTSPAADSRWWGIKLYRRIGTGAWTEITGANGTETGASVNTNGTPVWVSNNM